MKPSNPYKITTPTGETPVATMGDVLYTLNASRHAPGNPYLDIEGVTVTLPSGEILPVHRTSNDNGVLLPNTQTAACWFIQFMDEVEDYAIGIDGEPLKPAQMRRSEWGAINAIGRCSFGIYGLFNLAHHAGQPAYVPIDLAEKTFLDRFGYGHNGPAYGNGRDINCRHELHIGYALLQGNPVHPLTIAEYQAMGRQGQGSDAIAFAIANPFVHGQFQNVQLLETALSLLRRDGRELDETVMHKLKALEPHLPANWHHVQLDNAMFIAGMLSPEPYKRVHTDLGQPVSPRAIRLREALIAGLQEKQKARQAEDLRIGRTTRRRYVFQLACIDDMPQHYDYRWANRVVSAIEGRDVHAMLSIFDCPDNKDSKRFLEAEFGVKLRDVTAAQRRRAVLAFCGIQTEQAIAEFEAQEVANEAKRKAQQLLHTARNAAHETKIRFEGEDLWADEYVDLLIKRGHTQLVTDQRGTSTRTYLQNPTTGLAFMMCNKHRTLAYARHAVAQLAMPAAKPSTEPACAEAA
jgi:hypothetical protein